MLKHGALDDRSAVRAAEGASDIRRREGTKAFAERYGEVPIAHVGDEIVADWLAGGARLGSVQALCSMFNDAASMKAGRLIDRNPFQKLGISRGKGRRDQQPPSEQQVWEIISHAHRLSSPSFAAWLQVAAFTGLRPGGAPPAWEGSLYLATRHFAGWYMVNELEMPSEDVAIALGHQNGGNLVRRLYGHRDKGRALDRIVDAYADAANGAVRENRPRRSGSSTAMPSQQSLFGDICV